MDVVRNGLLLKSTDADFAALAPQLELVELVRQQILLEPNVEIDFVYYPETCVCSVLALAGHKPPLEVGMFGAEGMSNFVLRAGDRSFLQTGVFLPGKAWRIPSERFAKALQTLPSLNEVTLCYKDACMVQFAFTSWASGSFTIHQRLARWLLMLQDRTAVEALPVIHDMLAAALCVRRSGVTSALHMLEGAGTIKAKRGSIRICDRAKLREIAGASYGPAENAYRSLMSV